MYNNKICYQNYNIIAKQIFLTVLMALFLYPFLYQNM